MWRRQLAQPNREKNRYFGRQAAYALSQFGDLPSNILHHRASGIQGDLLLSDELSGQILSRLKRQPPCQFGPPAGIHDPEQVGDFLQNGFRRLGKRPQPVLWHILILFRVSVRRLHVIRC